MLPARQWGLVCVLTGGAGHVCNDERADGCCTGLSGVRSAGDAPGLRLWKAASGHRRGTREGLSPVAVNWRPAPEVYAGGFLVRAKVMAVAGSMDWAGSQQECSDP